jgi:succinate dehydrogenase cytochrome b subunit
MVKPAQYLTYRGRAGQWSWILHRITGLGVLLFLILHILDIALIGWGPKVFNSMLVFYRAPVFRVGEVLLVGAVLYHALNGVRIIIIDFWPSMMGANRKLMRAVVVIFLVVYLPTAVYMMRWALK